MRAAEQKREGRETSPALARLRVVEPLQADGRRVAVASELPREPRDDERDAGGFLREATREGLAARPHRGIGARHHLMLEGRCRDLSKGVARRRTRSQELYAACPEGLVCEQWEDGGGDSRAH